MRRTWINLLKVGVTVVGLLIVLFEFDLTVLAATLRNVRFGWATVAFLLVNLSLVVRAYRWWMLLLGLLPSKTAVSFGRLVELYFVGNFYNTFLPSGFGGDVVRVLEVAQEVEGGIAAGTVLVDRLTGLLTLFMIALLSLPFRPASFPAELLWPIVVLCVAGLVAGFVVLQGGLALWLIRWLPARLERYVARGLQPVLTAVQHCGWPAILKAVAVSVGFTIIMVGWWAAAGRALGFALSLPYLLLVIPMLSITLLIPSIGGLGVRESVAPLLFAGAGLGAAEAAALAFLVFIVERLSGLLGAPIYIWSLLRKRAA